VDKDGSLLGFDISKIRLKSDYNMSSSSTISSKIACVRKNIPQSNLDYVH